MFIMTKDIEDDTNEEYMMDDFDDLGDYEEDSEIEMLTSVLQAASKSANKLTSLIVENNNRNSIAMTSEDIYDIFRNSFIVALTTIAPSQND